MPILGHGQYSKFKKKKTDSVGTGSSIKKHGLGIFYSGLSHLMKF